MSQMFQMYHRLDQKHHLNPMFQMFQKTQSYHLNLMFRLFHHLLHYRRSLLMSR
jgi:hypothetical protein